MKKKKSKKPSKKLPEYNKGGKFWGDVGAGAAGIIGGALGTVPIVGNTLQQGVYGIHGALDKDITDEEKSIRGYSQAASGITTGLLTGNTAGAIQQGASGIGQGISSGSADDETAQRLAMGINAAGSLGSLLSSNPNSVNPARVSQVPFYPTPTGTLRNGGQFNSYNNNGLLKKPTYIFNKGGMYCMGGKMQYLNGGIQPNAEIEKQENVRYPDGETEQFNGPSHEQGGISVNLEPGTQIFSDKLKASTGKTFAKEAKKYSTEKFVKILEDQKADKLAKESAKIMFMNNNKQLSNLFNEQESQKQAKVTKYAAKNGYHIMPNGSIMSNQEMKYPNGGKITKKNTGTTPIYQIRNVGGVDKAYVYDTKNFNTSPSGFTDLPVSIGSVREIPIQEYVDFASKFSNQVLYGQSGDVQNTFQNPYIPNFEHTSPKVEIKKKGGWIQNAINPAHKGYCTPMTKATCTPHRKALAMTFKKHHGFHKNGGTQLPIYQDGDLTPLTPMNLIEEQDNYNPQLIPITKTYTGNELVANSPFGPYPGSNIFPNANLGNIAFQGINALGQNFGNLRDIYQTKGGKEYDRFNYGQVDPNLVSDRAAINDATQAANVSRAMIRDASGGNSGSYLSNIGQTQANTVQQKAKIREQFGNINAGIKNQFAQYNNELRNRGMEATAASKARSEDIARQAYNNIGQNIGMQSRDIRLEKMDQNKLNLLKNLYPNFNFDQKDWKVKFKQANPGIKI